eukprot:SAG31_NODE_9698_length_1240_cov_1.474145_2_plen_139_part_00
MARTAKRSKMELHRLSMPRLASKAIHRSELCAEYSTAIDDGQIGRIPMPQALLEVAYRSTSVCLVSASSASNKPWAIVAGGQLGVGVPGAGAHDTRELMDSLVARSSSATSSSVGAAMDRWAALKTERPDRQHAACRR